MEGDADTGQLTPSAADDTADLRAPVADPEVTGAASRQQSRMGRRWLVGVVAVLIATAGGIGAGGYLALRSHRASEATARGNLVALTAAKECITAMNAPDAATMYANMPKVIECATDEFVGQVPLFGVAAEAYETYDIHVQLLDLRAAVERNNPDGSIDILAALREQSSSNGEVSQRLRVTMRFVDGQYKIAKLDRVGR